jgi:hypothetical protein
MRTQFSLQAQDLASSMNASFARMRIAPGQYVPELTAPEGPSTGGGVQAMQRIRLVPQAPGFPVLVVGSANHAQGMAELRTYDHVDAIHRHRFKRPVALDRAQYDQFLEMAKNFLEVLRLRVTLAGPSSFVPESEPLGEVVEPAAESGKTAFWVLLGLVLFAMVVVGAVAVYLFVIRK